DTEPCSAIVTKVRRRLKSMLRSIRIGYGKLEKLCIGLLEFCGTSCAHAGASASVWEDVMRRICLIALTAVGVAGMNTEAHTQVYPSRPVTLIVPWPAGGPSDGPARLLTERMRVPLGQPVVIENVSGGSGSAGTGRVARASPDGYTIVHGNFSTHVINGAV